MVYALPCIMKPGLAVVISPLMMLMCDQVVRLRGYGINTCYYNTLLTDNERRNILHNLKQPNCQYQFVFVSPEAAITDSFQSCLDTLKLENRLNVCCRLSGIVRLPLTQAIFPDNIHVNNDQQLESLHDLMSQLEGKLQSLRSVVKIAQVSKV